jgi:hypothetical protein
VTVGKRKVKRAFLGPEARAGKIASVSQKDDQKENEENGENGILFLKQVSKQRHAVITLDCGRWDASF